ncbi:MAG: hypothetical protein QM755_20335 [Luteolibacter sp.]
MKCRHVWFLLAVFGILLGAGVWYSISIRRDFHGVNQRGAWSAFPSGDRNGWFYVPLHFESGAQIGVLVSKERHLHEPCSFDGAQQTFNIGKNRIRLSELLNGREFLREKHVWHIHLHDDGSVEKLDLEIPPDTDLEAIELPDLQRAIGAHPVKLDTTK